MEAAPAGKKHKSDLGQESLGSGNGVEETSLDLISRLPDEVLGTVISLLPTKDGARTQAISRRWRRLWRAAPLNLCFHLSGREPKRIVFVSKVLSDHPGPARRLDFRGIRLRDRYAKIDGWLHSRALTGLQEIYFRYEIEKLQLPYPLPPSALRFAPTLCVADFGNCDFPREVAPSLSFPCLKQLTLYRVIVLEDVLHRVLCGCPVLESLLLFWSSGFSRLRINSPTLRSIGIMVSPCRKTVENHVMLQDLIIEDSPCLERLLPHRHSPNHGLTTIRVVRAPKLEILSLLSNDITNLHLGTNVFQKMIAVSLTTLMHTVKVLALDSLGPNLDSVVDFLKCFPRLQKLYVESHLQKSRKNKRCYSPLDPIECLESHLRQVVVTGYCGMRPDVDFAKFFVLNAKVLKIMVFGSGYANTTNSDKWMTDQHRRLQLDKRASQAARFKFIGSSNLKIHDYYQETHDLSMDDPFDSHLCR